MDELGHLTCSYLGTDPSVFTAPPASTSRELNYAEMEREIKELQKDIRQAEKGYINVHTCTCYMYVSLISSSGFGAIVHVVNLIYSHEGL